MRSKEREREQRHTRVIETEKGRMRERHTITAGVCNTDVLVNAVLINVPV